MSDTLTKRDWTARVLGVALPPLPLPPLPLPPLPQPPRRPVQVVPNLPPLPQVPPPNLPQLPPTPLELSNQAKPQYEATLRNAKPVIDAADRIVSVMPVPNALTAAAGIYATASADLAATLQTPYPYVAALNDLQAKEIAAKAVLKAKAQADVAAMKKKQVATQQSNFEEMDELSGEVIRTYFNPNAASSSDGIRKEKLSPGKHFTTYLTALAKVEQSRANLPRNGAIPQQTAASVKQDCDTLVQAAQSYLDHFQQDFSDREKRDKSNQRKFQIVSEGIKAARQFALAMEVKSIAPPTDQAPWDRQTETRAGSARAAMAFETGYKKGSSLNEEGYAGASEAFWVESLPLGSKKATKNFIFKPTRGEEPTSSDHIQGGGATREALASANAKLFAQQTGIDMGIPETQVTTIGSYALDLKGAAADGQSRVGSLQEFAPSDGSLMDMPPTILNKIPAKECQNIALYDIMAMNFDRHAGNLLLQTPKGGGNPKMIPIDHGATLPTRKDFDEMSDKIGGLTYQAGTVRIKNAMLGIPGAYEKFDPETIAKLDQLDPDAMEQGMRDQLDALDQVNPGLNAKAKVSDETLKMSNRSMKFTKAAAHELSPAEIQLAIGQHGAELFDAPDNDFDRVVASVIADMKPKGAAYKEIFTSSGHRRDEIFHWLTDNGWSPGHGELGKWVMAHPDEALKLFKAGVANPAGQDSGSIKVAGPQDAANFLATTDNDKILRQSIGKLVAEAVGYLRGMNRTLIASLAPLQTEIKDRLAAGDVAGAEEKARELETQAMYLGLPAVREEALRLYDQAQPYFKDMGTKEEEEKKMARTRDSNKRSEIQKWILRRVDVQALRDNIVTVTGPNPDLHAAQDQLEKLRKRVAGLAT